MPPKRIYQIIAIIFRYLNYCCHCDTSRIAISSINFESRSVIERVSNLHSNCAPQIFQIIILKLIFLFAKSYEKCLIKSERNVSKCTIIYVNVAFYGDLLEVPKESQSYKNRPCISTFLSERKLSSM